MKAFRLNKETTDIPTKYCEWPKIEQHCATFNLRFPVKSLSSLMVAGFLVHCANADVEAVSGEASLDHHGESESFGSVPDAVSSALETEPRMPMRDVTEHKRETERARHGLLSTLHVDIEASCRMGGLYIGRSKRVSFDGTLLNER